MVGGSLSRTASRRLDRCRGRNVMRWGLRAEGIGYGVRAVKEGEGSKVAIDGKYFGKEVGGIDEAGKEYKAEEMLACPLLKPV